MAGRKKEKAKLNGRRVERGFVTYGGHIPELDMILSGDGYYFKMYLAGDMGRGKTDTEASEGHTEPERCMEPAFMHAGFKLQLIAKGSRVYILMGTKADRPEEAEGKFKEWESHYPYWAAACGEWFGLMSERLLFEPFTEIPEENKRRWRRRAAPQISLVQPYHVKKGQKEMELSGRTVKTVLLMGYPSRLFEAFATELLGIADNLALVIHAEELAPKRCLDGVNLSGDIRPARKAAMKGFLEETIKNKARIYNTCALVAIDGLPGEVEESFRAVKHFCEKYLLSLSELDYQQADAWRSALPLMKNHIRYHRVLTEENLKALFPWSELKRCKQTVFYGTDAVSGQVFYDRRIHRENGFILAGDSGWALRQAVKEMEAYRLNPVLQGGKISILGDESMEPSIWGQGKTRQTEVSCEGIPLWLLKAVIARWAVHGLSTNGRTMKKHMDMVMKAAESLEEGNSAMADSLYGESCVTADERKMGAVDAFLFRLGEQERRALSIRPFRQTYRFQVTETGYGDVYQVTEKGIQAEIGYALMFWRLTGTVYSLNSELLAWNFMPMYKLHENTMYTFLTRDNRMLYESRNFSDLFQHAPFLLLGEHGIYEKLKLSEAAGLDKGQRDWISEPAKGAVLMTKLAAYHLVGESGESKKGKEGGILNNG